MIECSICHKSTTSHVFGLCPDCWTKVGQPESQEALESILHPRKCDNPMEKEITMQDGYEIGYEMGGGGGPTPPGGSGNSPTQKPPKPNPPPKPEDRDQDADDKK